MILRDRISSSREDVEFARLVTVTYRVKKALTSTQPTSAAEALNKQGRSGLRKCAVKYSGD